MHFLKIAIITTVNVPPSNTFQEIKYKSIILMFYEIQKLAYNFYLICLSFAMTVVLFANEMNTTQAHIFINTTNVSFKDKGQYRIIFLPYPGQPNVNDTTTQLNFNVQLNNTDVVGLFVSLIVQDKSTGKIISQSPYSFHEFGDVTFPYVFNKSGDYLVGLQSKINGDPLYEQNPLVVSFDLSVNDMSNKTQELLLYLVLPVSILGIVVFYLNYRSGRNSKHSRDGSPK